MELLKKFFLGAAFMGSLLLQILSQYSSYVIYYVIIPERLKNVWFLLRLAEKNVRI